VASGEQSFQHHRELYIQYTVWHAVQHREMKGTEMTSDDEKIRENRLRRAAERQGLALAKSRRRDVRALGHGTYMVVDPQTNAVVAKGLESGYGMSLDEVEDFLMGDDSHR
jgi:hypothetical protein